VELDIKNTSLHVQQCCGKKCFKLWCVLCAIQCMYSAESALIRHTVQPFTESDDTRCCDDTICPPEDGHVDPRNMSRIVM
jgi:hypothetical protein